MKPQADTVSFGRQPQQPDPPHEVADVTDLGKVFIGTIFILSGLATTLSFFAGGPIVGMPLFAVGLGLVFAGKRVFQGASAPPVDEVESHEPIRPTPPAEATS